MKRPMPALRLTAIAGVLCLAACAKLLTTAPLPLYRLTAPDDFAAGLAHSSAQVVIDAPYAPAGLDTARIAIAQTPTSLNYLADGEWTDRVPQLVRTALVEGFENSRAFAAVGPDSLDLRADFVLEGDLRHFEALYDSPTAAAGGPPTVLVTLAVKLVKVPEHKIVAQTLLTARQAAAANATPQIVTAFNAAMTDVARQAVRWTLANAILPAAQH